MREKHHSKNPFGARRSSVAKKNQTKLCDSLATAAQLPCLRRAPLPACHYLALSLQLAVPSQGPLPTLQHGATAITACSPGVLLFQGEQPLAPLP